MDFLKIDAPDVIDNVAKDKPAEVIVAELCELNLALIGGGIGDVVPA